MLNKRSSVGRALKLLGQSLNTLSTVLTEVCMLVEETHAVGVDNHNHCMVLGLKSAFNLSGRSVCSWNLCASYS